MLIGEYNHSVDAKGRIIMPAKFRDDIGELFYITISQEKGQCLKVYSPQEWNLFFEKNHHILKIFLHIYKKYIKSTKIDDKSIEYSTTPLMFNDICIEIDNSKDAKSYFDRINRVLNKEEEYRIYINKECNRLLDMYYDLFLAGGLIKVNQIHKIIKPLAKKIIRGKSHNIEYLVNNIRCESHRWAISRALKNKCKIL